MIFRLLALLLIIAICCCVAYSLLSGDKRYMKFALQLLKVGIALALVYFGLMIFERLIILL